MANVFPPLKKISKILKKLKKDFFGKKKLFKPKLDSIRMYPYDPNRHPQYPNMQMVGCGPKIVEFDFI